VGHLLCMHILCWRISWSSWQSRQHEHEHEHEREHNGRRGSCRGGLDCDRILIEGGREGLHTIAHTVLYTSGRDRIRRRCARGRQCTAYDCRAQDALHGGIAGSSLYVAHRIFTKCVLSTQPLDTLPYLHAATGGSYTHCLCSRTRSCCRGGHWKLLCYDGNLRAACQHRERPHTYGHMSDVYIPTIYGNISYIHTHMNTCLIAIHAYTAAQAKPTHTQHTYSCI